MQEAAEEDDADDFTMEEENDDDEDDNDNDDDDDVIFMGIQQQQEIEVITLSEYSSDDIPDYNDSGFFDDTLEAQDDNGENEDGPPKCFQPITGHVQPWTMGILT